MRFIRFVQARRHSESSVEDGLFGLAYELRDSPQIAAEDRAMLADALTWFANHLETPSRLNRTTSKGYNRRNTRGIARLDYQESHIIESQTSWAIELSTLGVVHVTDPHHEIEPERSVNIVHLKALEFGIVKPVRK